MKSVSAHRILSSSDGVLSITGITIPNLRGRMRKSKVERLKETSSRSISTFMRIGEQGEVCEQFLGLPFTLCLGPNCHDCPSSQIQGSKLEIARTTDILGNICIHMKPHEVYDITTHNLWNSLQITETESESYTKVLIEKYPGLVRLVVSCASSTSKSINLWTYLYPYLQHVFYKDICI